MWLCLDFFQSVFFLSLLLNNFYCFVISLIPLSFPSIVLLSPSIELKKKKFSYCIFQFQNFHLVTLYAFYFLTEIF